MILKAGVRCGRVTNSSTGCVSTMQRWPPPGHGCAIGTSQCTVPLRRCRGAWWGSFPTLFIPPPWSGWPHGGEPMHGAVASMQGRVVGLVHYLFHRSTWTSGDYCYLQDLYVAPAARQLGCARQLIGHVYEEARKKGASRVYWLTHESNTTAMRLYDQVAERPGFIQYRHVLPRTTG